MKIEDLIGSVIKYEKVRILLSVDRELRVGSIEITWLIDGAFTSFMYSCSNDSGEEYLVRSFMDNSL